MIANVYTDGSGTTRGNPGGWAVVIRYLDSYLEVSGGCEDTTNNRMELTAAISGIMQAAQMIGEDRARIDLHSDSEYVVMGINDRIAKWTRNGFRRSRLAANEIANADLWRELARAIECVSITAHWVRGHNGHPENERCDKLAGAERARLLQPNTKTTQAKVSRLLPSLI